jgi:hypothetical protein
VSPIRGDAVCLFDVLTYFDTRFAPAAPLLRWTPAPFRLSILPVARRADP